MTRRCSPDHVLRFHRQRGAIGLMAAIVMLLAFAFLMLAIDSGRLYLEKRSVQRVADMAALEAVLRDGNCLAGTGLTTAQAYAAENAQLRNGFTLDAQRTLLATCGNVDEGSSRRSFSADATGSAIQVNVSHQIPASLILGGLFGEQVTISALAVAAKRQPLAALTLRTTLVSVDSTQAPLLDKYICGLLGCSINLSAVGWDGLAKSQINLVDFLDQLAISQGLTVGDYQKVLDEGFELGELLTVAATTLEKSGSSADIEAAIGSLTALSAVVPAKPLLQLGDLITAQGATQKAGLETTFNLLQLVQSSAELANSQNAVNLTSHIDVLGLGDVTLSSKVIEPPQLSAIGNPELAKADPFGPNQIAVRSAQIRTALSINLSGDTTDALADELDSSGAISSVGDFLNSALNLDLIGAINDLVGTLVCGTLLTPSCNVQLVSAVEVLPNKRIDIMLDVAEAQAHVTDYSCTGRVSKTLEVEAKTAALTLAVGQLGTDSADAREKVFNSPSTPTAAPMPLIMLGEKKARPTKCLITLCSGLQWLNASGDWVSSEDQAEFIVHSGIGIAINSSAIGNGGGMLSLEYSDQDAMPLLNVGKRPFYKPAKAKNLVSGLSDTLAGIDLEPYTSSSPGLLGNLITSSVGLINSLLTGLEGVIKDVLAPLVDPLVNTLLNELGIDLAKADVGANLTCGSRAELLL